MGTDLLCLPSGRKTLHPASHTLEGDEFNLSSRYFASLSAEGTQGRRPDAKPSLQSAPSLGVTFPALHDVLTLAAGASRQEKLLALTCDRMIKDLKIKFLKAILKSPTGMGDTDDSENSGGGT